MVLGGHVTLERGSRVRGGVVVFGGQVEVAGRVEGNICAVGGDVRLRSTAVVDGDVLSSGNVVRDEGAIVRGQQVSGARGGWNAPLPALPVVPRWFGLCSIGRPARPFGWLWGAEALGRLLWWGVQRILGILTLIALGILIVLLIPGPAHTVSEALVAYPVQSIGMGVLTSLAALLLIPLLIITCIGIPAAALVVIALAIATLFGWIAAGLALGDQILVALKQPERQPLVAVALGLLILAVLSNLPCLGFLVVVLVGAWGLGAVVLTRLGSLPYAGAPPRVRPPTVTPESPIQGDGGQG